MAQESYPCMFHADYDVMEGQSGIALTDVPKYGFAGLAGLEPSDIVLAFEFAPDPYNDFDEKITITIDDDSKLDELIKFQVSDHQGGKISIEVQKDGAHNKTTISTDISFDFCKQNPNSGDQNKKPGKWTPGRAHT
jgi:hypothetical protein